MLAVAGLALAVPATASAEFLDFTVDEGTVPGTPDNVFTADKLNGAYAEVISFDGMGGFEATIYINFSQYLANEGKDSVAKSFLTASPIADTQYGLYATYTATGTIKDLGGGDFSFHTTSADARLFIDPDTDTTKALPASGGDPVVLGGDADDYLIMTASNVVRENNRIQDDSGFFDITFDDPTFTAAGALYWPTLPLVEDLFARVTGDFDEFDPVGTVITSGDVSLVFEVPEPATMALFGLGLMGSAMAVRRRNRRKE
jgi:hypothetical protein